MAGAYPDYPGRRMAYDADGTAVLTVEEQTYHSAWESPDDPLTNMGTTPKQNINDENLATDESYAAGTGNPGALFVIAIFPELREIDGYYTNGDLLAGVVATEENFLQSSGNTTNGIDGTWAAIGTQVFRNAQDQVEQYEDYRDEVSSASVSNVRSVALLLSYNATGANAGSITLQRHHIFGEISSGETPDRLLFVDELTSLEFSLPKDYGDVPRGSARDYEWRLKNNSGSLTANTVGISAEDLYRGSSSWYTFDVGAGFAATRSISSIGNGASSALLTTRQILPDAATVGLHAARIKITVSSWT